LEDYPELEPEDLRAVLLYAHHLVANETIHDRLAGIDCSTLYESQPATGNTNRQL
jgi:hypothetical protein